MIQNANIGITRMRIISNQDSARTTSCLVGTMSNFYWTGAVEDYSLSIVSTSSLNINGGHLHILSTGMVKTQTH